MVFVKSFILFSLIVSVSALVTPHNLRSPNKHRGLSARVPVPEPVAIAEPQQIVKRCRPRPSTPLTTASANATNAPNVPNAPNAPNGPNGNLGTHPISSSTTTTTTTTNAPKTPAADPTPTPTPTPTPKPPTSNPGNLPSYMIGTQSGDGTFYSTGLGSCGITNNDGQNIVAVSHLLYDSFPGYQGGNPNNNPICGRKVVASYGGKSVTLTITDRCTGCQLTDLDMAPSAFNQLADPSIGRIHGVTWVWDPPNN